MWSPLGKGRRNKEQPYDPQLHPDPRASPLTPHAAPSSSTSPPPLPAPWQVLINMHREFTTSQVWEKVRRYEFDRAHGSMARVNC